MCMPAWRREQLNRAAALVIVICSPSLGACGAPQRSTHSSAAIRFERSSAKSNAILRHIQEKVPEAEPISSAQWKKQASLFDFSLTCPFFPLSRRYIAVDNTTDK